MSQMKQALIPSLLLLTLLAACVPHAVPVPQESLKNFPAPEEIPDWDTPAKVCVTSKTYVSLVVYNESYIRTVFVSGNREVPIEEIGGEPHWNGPAPNAMGIDARTKGLDSQPIGGNGNETRCFDTAFGQVLTIQLTDSLREGRQFDQSERRVQVPFKTYCAQQACPVEDKGKFCAFDYCAETRLRYI